GGQRPFDGEGSELRVGDLRQLERLREGTVGGIGTVDRDQDSLERHQLLTCSVAAIGRGWGARPRSGSTSGWEKRGAMAVGTIADSTTTVINNENWVRSMIPALRPYRDVIVPNVSPVDISSVVNVACGAVYRLASG